MDARTLSEVMGGTLSLDRYEQLLPGYLNAMKAAGITTVERAAMWAAQLGHESSGLRHMEELWGPTADQRSYDGRMGNRPGTTDWSDFRGRGPIQLTGRNNYRAFTAWAHANGHSTLDFEAVPTLVSQPQWGFLAAAWYWTSRPSLNKYADARDLLRASAVINGWFDDGTGKPRKANGWNDRHARYQRALAMGARLLPGDHTVIEKVLDYPRDQVFQDTYYNCGPASAQTIIRAATGRLLNEVDLGVELGTHRGGTDWIGQFPAVLNKHLPGAQYKSVEMPNDPPTTAQKDRLWRDIVASVDAGYGVVINIVAPVSNYPKAVYPSTISPNYAGGTVYHYIAGMGYRDDGQKKVWIADSGFSPFGYWISLDQLATLVPPKGYAYSTAPSTAPSMTPKEEGPLMALSHDEQVELLEKIRYIYGQLGPWIQLGENAKGQPLTLVDGVSAGRHDVAHLTALVNHLIAIIESIEENQ